MDTVSHKTKTHTHTHTTCMQHHSKLKYMGCKTFYDLFKDLFLPAFKFNYFHDNLSLSFLFPLISVFLQVFTYTHLQENCVVLCIVCFVSFCVLFVCMCVLYLLYYCHLVATQLQLTNISRHNMSYHIICHISYHISYRIIS